MANQDYVQAIYNRGDTSFGDWAVVSPGTPFTSANPRGLLVLTGGTAYLESEQGNVITLSGLSANAFLPLMPMNVLTNGSATLAALW